MKKQKILAVQLDLHLQITKNSKNSSIWGGVSSGNLLITQNFSWVITDNEKQPFSWWSPLERTLEREFGIRSWQKCLLCQIAWMTMDRFRLQSPALTFLNGGNGATYAQGLTWVLNEMMPTKSFTEGLLASWKSRPIWLPPALRV